MAEKKNPHALPIQEKWIKLTAKEVKHIFIYYEPSINDEKFYIFSAIFSFVVGFSNGKIIVRLDNSSDKIAELNFANFKGNVNGKNWFC